MRRPTNSSALRWRRRRMKARKKGKTWLDNKFIRGLRKMKLVGLKQALEPGLFWIERLLWMGVFAICVGFAIYLTVIIVQDYKENPTSNNFRDDEPIFKFPFAAVTITGTTILQNNAVTDTTNLFFELGESKDNEVNVAGIKWTYHLYEILLFTIDHLCELANSFASKAKIVSKEHEEYMKLADHKGWVQRKNVTLYDNKNDTDFQDAVIPYLKNKTLNCENIVAACFWEGTEENCTEVFVPVQTDVGNGCSFNRIPDQLLRKGRGLISVLNDHNYTAEQIRLWKDFDLDSAISMEGFRDFKDLIYPRAQHNAGKLSGLSFMLIFPQNSTGTSCPIVDSFGYLIGIHSPFEDPRIMQTSVTVPPYAEVFIKVKADATIADKQIRNLSVAKRKCWFQSENPLENFLIYTVSNCHQECLGRKIKEKCNCTLLTLSAGQNERLCGPLQVECVRNVTVSLENSGYDKQCRVPICYSACTELKYDADASFLPFHKNQEFDFSNRKALINKFPTSMVHLTHGSNSVPVREKKMQHGFSVLFGVIGGTWGMIMEFSMFTVFNIAAGLIVWFTPDCLEIDVDEDGDDKSEPRNTSSRSQGRNHESMEEVQNSRSGDDEFLGQENEGNAEEHAKGNPDTELDLFEETRLDQDEETRLDQDEEMRLDQGEETRLDQGEEMRLDQGEEMRLNQNEETRLDQDEEMRLDQDEETRLDQDEETRLDQEEETRLDQDEETRLDQDEKMRLDLDEGTRLDLDEGTRLDLDEGTRLDQDEEKGLDNAKEVRLDQEEEIQLDKDEQLGFYQDDGTQFGEDKEEGFNRNHELEWNDDQETPIDTNTETLTIEFQEAQIGDNVETEINNSREGPSRENPVTKTIKNSDNPNDHALQAAITDNELKETTIIADVEAESQENRKRLTSASKRKESFKTRKPVKTWKSLSKFWLENEVAARKSSRKVSPANSEVSKFATIVQRGNLGEQNVLTGHERDAVVTIQEGNMNVAMGGMPTDFSLNPAQPTPFFRRRKIWGKDIDEVLDLSE